MEMNNKTYILFTKAEGQKQIFQLDDANRPLDIQISTSQEISFSLAKAGGFDVQKKVIQLDHDDVSLDVLTTFFGQEISIYLAKAGVQKKVFQLDDGDGHLNIHIPAFRREISILHTRADGHSVVKQLISSGGADGPWNVQISTTHQEEPMEWAYDAGDVTWWLREQHQRGIGSIKVPQYKKSEDANRRHSCWLYVETVSDDVKNPPICCHISV